MGPKRETGVMSAVAVGRFGSSKRCFQKGNRVVTSDIAAKSYDRSRKGRRPPRRRAIVVFVIVLATEESEVYDQDSDRY